MLMRIARRPISSPCSLVLCADALATLNVVFSSFTKCVSNGITDRVVINFPGELRGIVFFILRRWWVLESGCRCAIIFTNSCLLMYTRVYVVQEYACDMLRRVHGRLIASACTRVVCVYKHATSLCAGIYVCYSHDKDKCFALTARIHVWMYVGH